MGFDREGLLKDYIRKNSTDLINLERNKIWNLPKLKILKAQYLDTFWINRLNKDDLFIIFFDSKLIDKFEFKSIETNLNSLIITELKTKNLLQVDENFTIIKSDIVNGEFHKPLIEVSKSDQCAFFFGPKGIDTCINGEIIDKLNFFYDVTNLQQFSEKFHITEIDKFFDFYQNQILPYPSAYRLFFADKALILKIKPGTTNFHILRNSPEKDLHNHLLDFLNRHTQHDFYKEIELQVSKGETDIFTEWDGRKYLFEVKWVGQSINKTSDGLSKPVTDAEVRDGVIQTLKYVREIIKHIGENLKYASVIVFDAREQKKDIDFKSFQFIPDKLKKYFKERFSTVRKLDISNSHPS